MRLLPDVVSDWQLCLSYWPIVVRVPKTVCQNTYERNCKFWFDTYSFSVQQKMASLSLEPQREEMSCIRPSLLCSSATFCTSLPFSERVWMRSKHESDSILPGLSRTVFASASCLSLSLPRVWTRDECSNLPVVWIAEWCLFWVQVLSRFVSAGAAVVFDASFSRSLSFLFIAPFFSRFCFDSNGEFRNKFTSRF